MTTTVDLTPFGFTSTESRVYNALLDIGPSSGYAVARAIGLARANTYHALSSLTAKGAIAVLTERPLRVRAVRPDGIVALIASRNSEQLEALEEQVRRRGQAAGAEATVRISTDRALLDIATRMIVREEGALLVLAPGRFYGATAPAWRKRQSDRNPSRCWSYGDTAMVPGSVISPLTADEVTGRFGTEAVLIAANSSAIWASWKNGVTGWWTQQPLAIGLVRTSIANVGGV